jgi:nicotinamidase/pyrazinamidase
MNKLLIIDPQNDFTDLPYTDVDGIKKEGLLSVPNSYKDYGRLIHLLNNIGDKINEIHVSLDTHTEKHIGHPKFWKQTDGSDIPNSMYALSINNDIITGTNILTKHGNQESATIEVVPKDDNTDLLQYVKDYVSWFDDKTQNTHGQRPFIWFQHCIENTGGHKINPTLKSALDSYANKVTYHIKGQNNLAEMYSLFKAERPVSDEDLTKLEQFVYTGKLSTEGSSSKTYDAVSKMKNLNTKLNEQLLKNLLGETSNQNTLYICGEARTHCVKSTIIDLLEYVEKNSYDQSKIIFIKNISSPIGGVPNDIVYKVSGVRDDADEQASGYHMTIESEMKDNVGKTAVNNYEYLYKTNYTNYNGKALDSFKIIEMLTGIQSVNSSIADTRMNTGYFTRLINKVSSVKEQISNGIKRITGRTGGRVSRKRRPKREGKRRSYRI